jgi:hypothetical protein
MTILTKALVKGLSKVFVDIFPNGGAPVIANVIYNGDSLADLIVGETVNKDAFIASAASAGLTLETVTDVAISGSFLMYSNNTSLSWWRDDNNTKGAYYTTYLDPIENKEIYTDFIISLTRNDSPYTQSVSAIKAAWNGYLAQLRIDFPNVARFYLKPLMRHPTLNDATNVARWEAYRTAMYEVIEDNADVYLLTECYDLPTQDNTHLTDAAELIEADRNGKRLAHENGTYNKPMLGMEITAADMTVEGLLCTITHYDGTDFTIPETPDVDILFHFEHTDGTVFDFSSTEIERVSANQLLIKTGAFTDPEKLITMYGTMYGVANTVTPKVPKDNSPNALPLTRSEVVPSVTDTFLGLENLAYLITPDTPKTFSSGTLVDGFVGINGQSWANNNASNRLDYDSSLYGGAGGYSMDDGNAWLWNDIEPTNEMLFFGVTTPRGTGGNALLRIGTAGVPSSIWRLYYFNEELYWYNEQSSNTLRKISTDNYDGVDIAWIVNVKSSTEMDIYINDGTTPIDSFDPRADITLWDGVIFGNCADGDHGMQGGCYGAHNGATQPSIETLMNTMKSRFNIT